MLRVTVMLVALTIPSSALAGGAPATDALVQRLEQSRLDRRAQLDQAKQLRDLRLLTATMARSTTPRQVRPAVTSRPAVPAVTLALPRPAATVLTLTMPRVAAPAVTFALPPLQTRVRTTPAVGTAKAAAAKGADESKPDKCCI